MPIADLFRQTVTLVEVTQTIGDIGGSTPTEVRATDLQGYIEPRDGTEDAADANRQIGDWRLYLPPDADVTGYTLVRYAGHTFDIVAPPRPWFDVTAGVDDHIEVDLREVKT